MRIILLIALLIPSLSFADKIILGGFSYHHNLDAVYNERHPAIGIEHNKTEYTIYKNSLNDISASMTRIELPLEYGGLKFGYRYGIASGYGRQYMIAKNQDPRKDAPAFDEHNNRLLKVETPSLYGFMPIAQLVASYEYERITIDFGFSTVSTVIFKVNL